MRCHYSILLSLGLVVAIALELPAWGADATILSRDRSWREQQMLGDVADGQLNEFTLFEAALLANGVHEPYQLAALEKQLAAIVDELKPQVEIIDDQLARATQLFELMHDRVLVGQYQSTCTQLATTLNEGHYNCVSATILFHVLCEACDLRPVAVATPTHVYSRLRTDDGTHDIQTTCAQWFRLSSEQQRTHTPIESSAIANHTPRELSDVQLLAKVYYNNGVRCLEGQQFELAEDAFRTSLQLDADDDTARENLLAGINNWALTFCDRGDFAEAARLLRRGSKMDAQYGPFLTNDLHIHQRWAQQLCHEGHYEQAVLMLEDGRRRQPDAPLFRDGPAAVYRMWAASFAERGENDAAIRVLDRGLQRYPESTELAVDRAQLTNPLPVSMPAE